MTTVAFVLVFPKTARVTTVHMNIRMVLQQTEIFSLRLWIKIRGVAVSQLRNSLF